MTPEQKSNSPEPIQPQPGSRVRMVINIILVLVLVLFSLRGPALRAMGRAGIKQDTPQKADLIVVPAGSPVILGLAAADYFKDGLGPKIFLLRGAGLEGAELVPELKLDETDPKNVGRLVLMSRGVPEEAIIQDSAFAAGFGREAERVKAFLAAGRFKSIILVTPISNSRRAREVFTRVLGPGIKIISLPSRYDRFDPKDWWRDPDRTEAIVLECVKLVLLVLGFGS